MTQHVSRIELARQRLRIARRAIGIAAAAGLVAFALAARASHPGSGAKSSAGSSAPSATSDTASERDFGFGQAAIAPSSSSGRFSAQRGGS